MPEEESRLSASFLMAAALLVLACAYLFFYNLDVEAVGSDDQARVLLTTSDMNARGTWRVTTGGAEERWEKPPLYVWAVKIASHFFDREVTPQVARIPGALSMLAVVLLAAWWVYQHMTRYPRADTLEFAPEAFALLTGLMVATNPEILSLAREGTADSLFTLLCFGSLYCFGESFETRRSFYAGRPWRQWVLAGYLLIGLAMMTKGPAAFLFVLLPYMATCLSYKMRRPDWIHLPGTALALGVGGLWYVTAIRMDPEAGRIFFAELFAKRFGADAINKESPFFYFILAIKSFFPWVLLAAVMAYRNLKHIERTPTMLTWSWVLVISLVWLSLVGSKRDEYFMPAAPFIMMLAGEALLRWNFDSKAGTAVWVLLRAVRWGAIALAIPYSVFWIVSDLGLSLAIALWIFGILFLLHRRRTKYVYKVWERTVHMAALLVIVFLCAEVVYVRDYVPRQAFRSRSKGFAAQVKAHLPEGHELFYYGSDDSALNSYLLGEMVPLTLNIDALARGGGAQVYLMSDEKVRKLMKDPRLVAVVTKFGAKAMRPRAALFKVITGAASAGEIALAERYEGLAPLRLAVLGDAGRGGKAPQKAIAKRLAKINDDHPFHEIIMLGHCVTGDSKLERIDFHKTFERPYEALLEQGVPFHAVLGRDDRPIASDLLRYPLLQMGGPYYARDFYGGLVRFIALDSDTLDDDGQHPQWAWLEKRLAESDARWKIVALDTPLLSLADGDETDRRLAERLLPILDRFQVNLVLWSAEGWYQRVMDPDHAPVFVGTGWSGRVQGVTFADDPRFLAGYNEQPGFVILEVTPEAIAIQAVNQNGDVVDEAQVMRDGDSPQQTAATDPS